MATSFLDWEDKQLVQIALEFEREGIRVTWSYVARRMAKSKRTASQLRLRLVSLKRTYGKEIKNFPRCFFSGSAPEHRLLSTGRHLPHTTTRRSQPLIPPPAARASTQPAAKNPTGSVAEKPANAGALARAVAVEPAGTEMTPVRAAVAMAAADTAVTRAAVEPVGAAVEPVRAAVMTMAADAAARRPGVEPVGAAVATTAADAAARTTAVEPVGAAMEPVQAAAMTTAADATGRTAAVEPVGAAVAKTAIAAAVESA
jgi:hypothetical protein